MSFPKRHSGWSDEARKKSAESRKSHRVGARVDVWSPEGAVPHIVKHVWTEGGKVSKYGVYPAEGKSKRFYNVDAHNVTKPGSKFPKPPRTLWS